MTSLTPKSVPGQNTNIWSSSLAIQLLLQLNKCLLCHQIASFISGYPGLFASEQNKMASHFNKLKNICVETIMQGIMLKPLFTLVLVDSEDIYLAAS